jgi:hypothetical protein
MACCEWVAAWVRWPKVLCDPAGDGEFDGAMGGGISMRRRPRPTFVEPNGAGTGFRQARYPPQCDGREGMLVVARGVGNVKLERRYEKSDYPPTFKPAEWRRRKHCALPTFQDCCVDTRSFAEVAEVTQRKCCQENCCRARQRPQEYVLCVYVWLYSDSSFYQFRDDESSWVGCVSVPCEDRLSVGAGLEGRVTVRVVDAMRCDRIWGPGVTNYLGGDKRRRGRGGRVWQSRSD